MVKIQLFIAPNKWDVLGWRSQCPFDKTNTRGSPCSSQLIRTARIRLFPPRIETLSSLEKNQEAWKPSLIIFTRTLLLVQTSASHRPLGVGKVTCYGSPFLHIPISDGAGWTGDILSHVLITRAFQKCQGMTLLIPELILCGQILPNRNERTEKSL